MSTLLDKVREIGLELPESTPPSANYVPWSRSGNLVFLAGQTSKWNGHLVYKGKLGRDLDVAEGKLAARMCMQNLLAVLNQVVEGDLARIRQCVRLRGFVNVDPEFGAIPQVIDGASDLAVAVLGNAGRHARAAVGVASLPGLAAVEVDAVFELAE